MKISNKSKLVLIFILFLNSMVTFAQTVDVSTVVTPPYSPYLSSYTHLKDRVVITLTNKFNTSKQVFLKARLFSDNGFSAQTIDQYKPFNPIVMGPNAMYQLPANDELYAFFNGDNISVNNGDNNIGDILADGVLPEGNYSLCIDVYDFNTDQKLSTDGMGCGMIQIKYLNAPKLIAPSCENDQLQYNNPQSIGFVWTPVIHNTPINYDLYIVKLLDGDVAQDVIENAIETGANDPFIVRNINNTSLNYNQQYRELKPGQYAWAVVAKVVNGQYPIVNNGLSNVCTFTVGAAHLEGNQVQAGSDDNISCSCKLGIPNGLTLATDVAVGTIVKTSHFEMEVTSIQKNGDLYSGTGFIPVPLINAKLIKAKVNFIDIEIRKSGNEYYHTAGIIKANVHHDATPFLPKPDVNDPGNISIGQNEMSNLSDFIKNNAEQKISWLKNAANSFAFSVPIGFDEKPITVIISDITFTPEQGYFQALSVVDMLDANSKFALLAKGVCIDKNSFCGDAKLMLAKDFTVPAIGLTLIGGVNNDEATSITFDKDGFKNLHIGAKYTFPAGSLIDKGTNTPATVTLQSDTEKGWNDWIAEVKFSPFYISGFDEFSFGPDKNGTKMIYDHSDVRNPPEIPSPYQSTDPNEAPIPTNLLTWRGFYIPAIQISLPGYFNNASNKTPTTITAEKLIFDGGLSGNVSVNKILDIGDGSMDSWYFSIDQFKLDLWKSSFKSSSLIGKIVLPLSHDYQNTTNQLSYTCTLSKPQNGSLDFSFIIAPKSDIAFDIFWAKARLTEGTSITVQKRGNQDFLAKAALFGSIDIQADIKDIPDIKLASVKFENLRIQSQQKYFDVDNVHFSTASPQHSIAGFTIDLDATQGRGISIALDPRDPGKVNLNFKALLMLADADFVPKADVDFNIYGKFGLKDGRPDWQGMGVELSSIKLSEGAQIGPIGVEGTIGYFNDHNGSYGFMGGLSMSVIGITVDAKAQFGYKSTGNNGYNYFFIDGMLDLGNQGIPFAPGLSLFGFGGGAYYNMEQSKKTYSGDDIKATVKYDPNDLSAFTSLSGIVYTPVQGTFGIKASVLVGTTNRNILDADGGVEMNFNANTGGVNYIMFTMNGRFIVKATDPIPQKNKDCMGINQIDMKMNFVENSFMFHVVLRFGVPNNSDNTLLGASGNLDFYVGSSGWFLHLGSPWKRGDLSGGDPISMNVLNIAFFKAYMQCGSGTGSILSKDVEIQGVAAVDPMPPIPDFIMNIIRGNHSGEEGSHANSENVTTQERGDIEGGLAFGANFDAKLDVKVLIFYMYAELMVGFDVGFYSLDPNAALCRADDGSAQQKGVNGFYAKGQAYIGAKIDLGVHVDLFFLEADISIIEAGAAAYIQMGMPSPTFFKGAIGGYFSVLGGLISGGFSIPFYIGEHCTDLVSEKIPLIASVRPETEFDLTNLGKTYNAKDVQEVYTQPTFTFNYKIDQTFLIKVPVPDPENEGQTYIEYRYYHLLPKDMRIWIGGAKTNKEGRFGQIFENNEPSQKPLEMNNFKVSDDGYSLVPKANLLFEKESTFRAEVSSPVRIFNLRLASKGENKYFTNNDRNQWDTARDEHNKVFWDQRKFTFTTNCGIKEIKEEWISDMRPFHRTQNNPYGVSSGIKEYEFRKASEDIKFTTVYNSHSYPINKSVNNQINKIIDPEYPVLSLSASARGGNIEGSFMFDESVLCIPDDFKHNFDFGLRVLSYDRAGNGESFQKNVYKVTIDPNNKSVISFQLPKDFPKNSYIIVQPIIKKKSNPNSQYYDNTFYNSEFKAVKTFDRLSINNRVIPISNKMVSSATELVLFSWYFKTGSFETYKDKMNDLNIKKGQPIKQTVTYSAFSKGGIKESKFEVETVKYDFYGKESFDHHDLNNFSLNEMFGGASFHHYYDKMLEDGYLGYAFDGASQEVVDSFLRIYFNDYETMNKFINPTGHNSSLDIGMENQRLFMKNYITDKMLDAVKYDVVNQNVLPFMENIPPDLIYNSSHSFNSYSLNNKLLFSLNKLAKVNKYLGSNTKIIPSHIITMKDVINYKPGVGEIIRNSFMTDGMNDFNNNIEGRVFNNFKPKILQGL